MCIFDLFLYFIDLDEEDCQEVADITWDCRWLNGLNCTSFDLGDLLSIEPEYKVTVYLADGQSVSDQKKFFFNKNGNILIFSFIAN